jgi:Tol biopolymer transport system component
MTLQPIVLFISLFLVSPLYGFAPIARHTTALKSAASGVQEFDTKSMTTSEELIPREVLFGNPTYASPQLSPDGKYLSFLAPSPEEDVLNVFVKGTTEPVETARMITDDKSRGIRSAFWAEDSKTILYMQDFEVRIQYNF